MKKAMIKKATTLLLVLLIAPAVYAQQKKLLRVNYNDGSYAEGMAYDVKKKNIYHGTYSKFDSDPAFKQDGEWKYYFENGKLEKTVNYVNNVRQGPMVWHYENGTVREKGQYKTATAMASG